MNFIAEDKMSKKQRAEINKARRIQWDFKPTTRVKPSAKVYNRKRIKYICDTKKTN